jgi:polyhydroxyalkanoate synthesis regulator phasin
VSEPNERDKEVAGDTGLERIIAAYREELRREYELLNHGWTAEQCAQINYEHAHQHCEDLQRQIQHIIEQSVQALMHAEAARRELHECRATLELERAEMGRLRAEVERLKQELVDMTHKHRNQCDATDGQTETLAYVEAKLDAERERLRSLPDRILAEGTYKRLIWPEPRVNAAWYIAIGIRWARRWLRREVGR